MLRGRATIDTNRLTVRNFTQLTKKEGVNGKKEESNKLFQKAITPNMLKFLFIVIY